MLRLGSLLLCLVCFGAQASFGQFSFERMEQRVSPLPGMGLLAADFNNDGLPDLLAYGGAQGNIGILLNQGGHFGPELVHGGFSQPIFDVKIGDLNNDGNLDVLSCEPHGAWPDRTVVVRVWLGNGSGTLSMSEVRQVGGCGLMVADFNGDRNLDVAVLSSNRGESSTAENMLTVLFGDGHGSFPTESEESNISAETPQDPRGPCTFDDGAVVDVNQDGHPDLFVTAECAGWDSSAGSFLMAMNDGEGHFQWSAATPLAGNWGHLQRPVQMEDGSVRIPALGWDFAPHASADSWFGILKPASVYQGNAVLTIEGCYNCETANAVFSGALVDLDGDGTKDVISGYTKGVDCCEHDVPAIALLQGQRGAYTRLSDLTGTGYTGEIAIADFDRDGRADAATFSWTAQDQSDAQLLVLLNRSEGPACAPKPELRSVALCLPTATTGSPVRVLASTTDNRQISGMKVYVDGKAAYTTIDDGLNAKVRMLAGKHRITVKAWDNAGSFSASQIVNVDGSCTATTDAERLTDCTVSTQRPTRPRRSSRLTSIAMRNPPAPR